MARGSSRRVRQSTKRAVDLVIASVFLLLLSPLLLLVALAIFVDSPGPILYRCRRVGRGGRAFGLLKFRKMHAQAEGGLLTIRGDERFTRIGEFLACSKIDELPQLWNVLRGDISIVGPRPEAAAFVARAPEYATILGVRPGITGLAQLAFAEESSILDPARPEEDYLERIFPQKIELDQLYVRRQSLFLDLKIVFWTFVAVVLRRQLYVDRRTGAPGLRRRMPRAVADETPSFIPSSHRIEEASVAVRGRSSP